VVLNRRRCLSFEPPPLGESYITKVADSELAVQSESSIDVVCSVNTERGTCSCHSGATGNICKHLKSVLIHNHIQSDLLYQGSPEERRYAIIAVWLEKLHPNSLASGWFRGFSKKKRLNACGFAREFLQSGMLYRLGKSLKRRGKSSSLHSKKNFLLGGADFL